MTKEEIRKAFSALRRDWPLEEKTFCEEKISGNILSLDSFKSCDILLCYAAYGKEISVDTVAKEALKIGKKVAFPLCNVDSETMRFYFVNDITELENTGAYGIREPKKDGGICLPTKNSLCIVPAIVYDRQGRRVGHGKGYYDKFLETFDGVTVGVAAEKFLVENIPYNKYDISINFVVTENEIIKIKG